MNKMDKTIALMELPFATQQPVIFLNKSIVTLCLKPANSFSLHRNKIQTPYRHLQSKAWMIWAQQPFSTWTLISYTPDLSFLVPRPQGLCTCTLLLIYTFPKSLHDGLLLIIQISAQMTEPYNGLPWLPWPKQKPPPHSSDAPHSSDVLLFFFFKTLTSI